MARKGSAQTPEEAMVAAMFSQTFRGGEYTGGDASPKDLFRDDLFASDSVLSPDPSGYNLADFYSATLSPTQLSELADNYLRSAGSMDPKHLGYGGSAPVPLTRVPMGTSNVRRPRTVASGWESSGSTDGSEEIGTLSVVFRDGTIINYDDVPRSVWDDFSRTSTTSGWIGDGRDTTGKLEEYSYFPADGASVSGNLYGIARAAQMSAEFHARRAKKEK